MNWKLILRLSLYGLAMGLGAAFFIPTLLEPVLWLIVYIFYAWSIGRNTWSRRFLHGLLLGMVNGLWITATRILFLSRYLPRHPRAIALIDLVHDQLHLAGSPRHILAITGPLGGIASGIVIGLFAIVGGMMTSPRSSNPAIDA